MNEELLHYIWKFQHFDHNNLVLTSQDKLEIKNSGTLNTNAGPDFFNGQIKIAGTIWAGNIEVHIKSSDWYTHKHEEDASYDKIILHVVWEDDRPVTYKDGKTIPTLELKGRVGKSILDYYRQLNDSHDWVPCANQLEHIEEITKIQCIESNLVQRLKTKSDRINQLLNLTQNNWEATLYQLMAKYFGFKVNAVPFELLASSIDYSVVRKYQHNEMMLTALFFGQAGFLNEEYGGSYPRELKEQYAFLKNKHQLEPLDNSIWKFMRMRPANFPTIRIAQFVAILTNNIHLFQRLTDETSVDELRKMLNISAHHYWDTHYRFDVPGAKKMAKRMGTTSINILLINVLIPLLFCYGEKLGSQALKNRALNLLQEIPAEKNSITKRWKELGMPLDSAYDSQGLIELKQMNCSAKNCLNCNVGNSILKRGTYD